ncbi:MAG TPA: PaaX family transcriptional regulator C-terminal domain-containing protein, partial [Mycobacteriales bacterium]|nr:PaaX family transcriptional regulator C-terminal domain-containing protein [Mycobacteriales bacterium]
MNARAALFDLYGDHLRPRGGAAPIASVIQLMAALDIAAPAVRTAVSRMVRQGWLTSVDSAHGAAYGLTDRGRRRLDEAAGRIYARVGGEDWDGRWSVLVLAPTTERSRRERLQRGLTYLGYRWLNGQTWVAPRRSVEAESVLAAEGVRYDEFAASYGGQDAALVDRLYDLDGLAAAYRAWLDLARDLVGAAGAEPDQRTAFAARSRLVHEWRKFLFRDPGLPPALLPARWPGTEAAAYFTAEADRLLPAATAFVDCCLPRRS